MDEIRLPQHAVNRIDRRWTARFGQMAAAWQKQPGSVYVSDDPLRSLRVRRLLEGSLRPPATEGNPMIEPR
jgi:hypothetical protein